MGGDGAKGLRKGGKVPVVSSGLPDCTSFTSILHAFLGSGSWDKVEMESRGETGPYSVLTSQ